MNESNQTKEEGSTSKGGVRDYTGKSGPCLLRISVFYDHFFLKRIYRSSNYPHIKVSWRFNEEGRIDLVDLLIYPNRDIYHFIKVLNFQKMQRAEKAWTSHDVEYIELPKEINAVNPGFSRLEYIKKYQSLLRFGHGMIKDLIINLNRRKVKDSYYLMDRDRQLNEIVNDEEAVRIIEKAGNLMPSIELSNVKGVFTIHY